MPASPGLSIYIGPDGGPFTVVGSANPLPVTANAGTGTFIVAGTVNPGVPPSGGPVYAGGFDGTNIQGLRTDTTGRLVLSPTSGGVSLAGTTVNGLSKAKIRDLTSTVQSIKSSAGTLYALKIINTQNVTAFIQLFDLATGSVSLGTTTPDWEIRVEASAATNGLPQATEIHIEGIPFGTAISVASSTTEKGATGSAAGVEVFALYQ